MLFRSRCLMNPDRKYRNGYRHCDNCKMSIAGPNYSRHINDCDGSAEDVVKRALQSFRSEFIKIIHNGDSAGRIDRTLGFGNRSVPEVVRANVERELLDRGMPSDWKITSSLLLDIPMKNVISDTELGVFAVTNSTASVKSDDYLFAIQVLQHHIAIYDNLSSVISDIITANEV